MKICGFTIIKNAVINQYPIVEAIRSLLPVVDEMIVLVGAGEDETEALIRQIDSDKLRIHHSVWDKTITTEGSVLAVETNKAFDLVPAYYDWAFYIQGDEVIHEKDYPAIKAAATKYKDDLRVEGLLFDFVQFYATYDYIGDSRRWYHHEVRIIRNDKTIRSYRDAQGFRKNGKKIQVKPIAAEVYHYGWVKSPQQINEKQRNITQYWQNVESSHVFETTEFDFSEIDSIEKFVGTHPQVMHERIKNQNWKVELDTKRKKFTLKDGFLYYVEKLTGKRLFAFRNYKII